jgi:hypothetical protein
VTGHQNLLTGRSRPPQGGMPTQDVAGQLLQIARDRRVPDRKKLLLRRLAYALEHQTGLDRWAGVDLRTVFQPEETISRPISDRLARGLEVLVFVPLVITWLGLAVAAREYRETMADPALRDESFLQRWQTGFGGKLDHWLTFDHVALYTLSSLAVIFAVAAARFWYRSRLEGTLAQLLDAAVTEAELLLGPIRLGQPSRVAAELDRVSAEIATTAAQVREVGQIAGETQAEAARAIAAVVAALSEIEAGLASVQASADGVGKASTDMGLHLARVAAAIQALTVAQADLGSKTEAAGDHLKGVWDSLSEDLKDAVADSHHSLSTALSESSQRIADALSAGADEVGAALADVRATAGAYTSRVESAGDILGRAAEILEALPAVVVLLEGQLRVLCDRLAALNQLHADKPLSLPRRLRTVQPRPPQPAVPTDRPSPEAPPSVPQGPAPLPHPGAPFTDMRFPAAHSPPAQRPASPTAGGGEQPSATSQSATSATGPDAPGLTAANQRFYSRIFRFRRNSR